MRWKELGYKSESTRSLWRIEFSESGPSTLHDNKNLASKRSITVSAGESSTSRSCSKLGRWLNFRTLKPTALSLWCKIVINTTQREISLRPGLKLKGRESLSISSLNSSATKPWKSNGNYSSSQMKLKCKISLNMKSRGKVQLYKKHLNHLRNTYRSRLASALLLKEEWNRERVKSINYFRKWSNFIRKSSYVANLHRFYIWKETWKRTMLWKIR